MFEKYSNIVSMLVEIIQVKAHDAGFERSVIDAEFQFFDSGVLDSLGFINVVAEAEDRLGVQLDFAKLAPNEFANIRALAESLMRARKS